MIENDMNERPNYTLWHRGDLVQTFDHNRDGMNAALGLAHELLIDDPNGVVELFSSRDDDRVWSSEEAYADEPYDLADIEADFDILASAGYGMDEDYGGALDALDADGIYY